MDTQLKEKILEFVENLEIDVTELPSYRYSPAQTYGWVNNPEPADDDWDEDEEIEAKKEKAIEMIKADGFWEFIKYDFSDKTDEELDELNKKIIEFLGKGERNG